MERSISYKEILDNLYDGVYFVNKERVITYWNRGAERITGFSPMQVMGRTCADNLLNHENEAGENLCLTMCPLSRTMETGTPQEVSVFAHHREGHRLPVLVRAMPLYGDDGQISGAVEVFSDNSKLIQALSQVDKLQRIASEDCLTGMANRRASEDRLQAAFADYMRNKHTFGVLFVDIDHFKRVNDLYGHKVGDRVLRHVADTLSRNLRTTDFVGRWGGEEFLCILQNMNRNLLASIAGKLRSLVETTPLEVGAQQLIGVTISMGGALSSEELILDELLKLADQRLYNSKSSGRNRVTIG